jgi:hypothetical protein
VADDTRHPDDRLIGVEAVNDDLSPITTPEQLQQASGAPAEAFTPGAAAVPPDMPCGVCTLPFKDHDAAMIEACADQIAADYATDDTADQPAPAPQPDDDNGQLRRGAHVTTEPAAITILRDRDGDRWVRYSNTDGGWHMLGGPVWSWEQLTVEAGPLVLVADDPRPPPDDGDVLHELVGGGPLLSDRQAALLAAALTMPRGGDTTRLARTFEHHLERDADQDEQAERGRWALQLVGDRCNANAFMPDVWCGKRAGHEMRPVNGLSAEACAEHAAVHPVTGKLIVWTVTGEPS